MDERLSKLLNNPLTVPSIVGILAFGAGTGLGYILGKRNKKVQLHVVPSETKFDRKEVEELISVKAAALKEDEKKTQIQFSKKFVTKNIKELVSDYKAESEVQVDEPVREPILAPESTEWSYEVELLNRTSMLPYVIHKDEFYANELDYTQSTLTYYAGDDILVDEEDSPIYNHNVITGPKLFGHGSGDRNVVYIRNDKRKAEYELLFDPGLYSIEVLGLHIEDNQRVKGLKNAKDLKHSGVRKFKQD